MRAATGWLSPAASRIAQRDLADVVAAVRVGEERIVGRDALERCAGQRGGELAAEGGGERLARADRVGQQRAAALQILAQLLALGRREAEVVPAVHEHQVVAEQVRVGDVDQLRRGADAQLAARPARRCAAGSPVRRARRCSRRRGGAWRFR